MQVIQDTQTPGLQMNHFHRLIGGISSQADFPVVMEPALKFMAWAPKVHDKDLDRQSLKWSSGKTLNHQMEKPRLDATKLSTQ